MMIAFICSMLRFNRSGLLVPDSIIISTIDEFETEFVTNIPTPERLTHFNSYLEYSKELKAICGDVELNQWINGSFVTKKARPADIDLVTFINHQILLSVGSEIKRFIYPNSEDIFRVDAYIVATYPPETDNYLMYQSDRAYWRDQFSKTRRNKAGNRLRKGFLEIVY